jgi:hypothetical protein
LAVFRAEALHGGVAVGLALEVVLLDHALRQRGGAPRRRARGRAALVSLVRELGAVLWLGAAEQLNIHRGRARERHAARGARLALGLELRVEQVRRLHGRESKYVAERCEQSPASAQLEF